MICRAGSSHSRLQGPSQGPCMGCGASLQFAALADRSDQHPHFRTVGQAIDTLACLCVAALLRFPVRVLVAATDTRSAMCADHLHVSCCLPPCLAHAQIPRSARSYAAACSCCWRPVRWHLATAARHSLNGAPPPASQCRLRAMITADQVVPIWYQPTVAGVCLSHPVSVSGILCVVCWLLALLVMRAFVRMAVYPLRSPSR
jgi:hypothetical protein